MMEKWDEVRSAFQVARIGTVSGAAEVLGVHHATVIRHVDALETRLGAKLFQRHSRGYTPTEAGRELLKIAQETEDSFSHLAARINGAGAGVSGDLVVTALPGFSALLAPTLVRVQQAHPGLCVQYVTDDRVFRLDHGEAHIAIRAGARPQDPDDVVQPLARWQMALFVGAQYARRDRLPRDETELGGHSFAGVSGAGERAPYHQWLAARIPSSAFAFRSNDSDAIRDAVMAGVGLGFLPVARAQTDPGLTEVLPPRAEWEVPLWLVTHVDLHRSAKIQAVLAALKHDMRGAAS